MYCLKIYSWSLLLKHYLWVLVVRWQGWPMSLGLWLRLGLKYSSAVRAEGFVSGHDVWVTIVFCKTHMLRIQKYCCTIKISKASFLTNSFLMEKTGSLTPLFGPTCCSAIPRNDCRGVLPPNMKTQHTVGHGTAGSQNIITLARWQKDTDTVCSGKMRVGREFMNRHIHYEMPDSF